MRTIYIISDLHLGGRWPSADDAGFRMMTHPDALAAFITKLSREPGAVELVINGDFIDFLAEEADDGWTPFRFDEADALKVFHRVSNERDSVVFDALSAFVASDDKRLTVMLGNHDLELSLPKVRAALAKRLSATEAMIQFIYDGEGYVVGDALIEHGNRYDPYNEVDHDALRRVRSLLTRGQAVDRADFKPPVGSRLVAEFINPIKRSWAFIDLLKPEGAALMALLLAIDPRQKVLSKLAQARWGARGHGPLKSDPSMPRDAGAISDAGTADPETLGEVLRQEAGFSEDDLKDACAWLPDPGNVSSSEGKRHAALLAAAGRWMTERQRLRQVKAALAVWPDPHLPFDKRVETIDAYSAAALRLTENGFRFVVFGHTHHAKDVAFPSGARYLNSGTWANLMRFPTALFADDPTACDAAWTAFVSDLKEKNLDPYVEFRPTAVRLVLDGAHVVEAGIVEPAAQATC